VDSDAQANNARRAVPVLNVVRSAPGLGALKVARGKGVGLVVEGMAVRKGAWVQTAERAAWVPTVPASVSGRGVGTKQRNRTRNAFHTIREHSTQPLPPPPSHF
jgi:hypothetical protein